MIIFENPSLTSTPSYNNTLFSILNKIRKEYDNPQRASICENNIRMNFSKLMELTQSSKQTSGTLRNIIIIIDGVDLYKDKNEKEESAE